jgi:hypothetical protein
VTRIESVAASGWSLLVALNRAVANTIALLEAELIE